MSAANHPNATRLIIAGGRDVAMTQAQWDRLTGLSDLVDEVTKTACKK
jgi:hypothetical protein